MFRIIILYTLIISGVCTQSKVWYDKFIKYIDQPDGVSVSVIIHEKQFELSNIDRGVIEIKSNNEYILDLPNETVYVKGDIIKTWNKIENQLIIDRKVKGNITIFDLFDKDFKGLKLGKSIIQNDLIILDFDIPKMGYGGRLSMLRTGEPKEIKIAYGPDQSVSLEINKFTIGGLNLYNNFNPVNPEVIDLRE